MMKNIYLNCVRFVLIFVFFVVGKCLVKQIGFLKWRRLFHFLIAKLAVLCGNISILKIAIFPSVCAPKEFPIYDFISQKAIGAVLNIFISAGTAKRLVKFHDFRRFSTQK